MIRTIILVVTALSLVSLVTIDEYSVNVTIEGYQHQEGQLSVALYNSDNGFPKDHAEAYQRQTVAIDDSTTQITFDGVPVGTYAVAVYHDENGNQELETNFMGIPKENVGISNNPKVGIGNPPSFKRAQFELADHADITVRLQNL